MKIRTPNCQCIICEDDGRSIIRAVMPSSIQAIRAMRKLMDGMIHERDNPELYQCDTSTAVENTPAAC